MADHDAPDDIRAIVVAEAVAGRRPPLVDRLALGRLFGIDDWLERLISDADPLGGAARLLRVLGRNDRDRLAEVADAVDREHRLVGELEPVGLCARDVGVGQHRMDPGHADGLRDVDLGDQGVRVRAAQRVAPEHPGCEEVARVGELAGHLRDRVDPLDAFADTAELERAGGRAHEPAASLDRVEDLRVPRAAAKVARQRLADLVVGRVRAARQQVGGRDHEPWRAEAALNRARLGESRLNRMQLAVLGQPLDRHELVAVRLGREDKAGADESAVEEHGAGAALALLARVLRAGEAEPLAEDVEQAFPGPDVGLEALAVDRQLDSHCRQRSTARTVSTRSELRR